MKAVAVIQSHHVDLLDDDRDPAHYCIAPLRECRNVAKIVIAAPDVPENQALQLAAAEWGIECHLGSEYDVTQRVVDAAAQVGASDDTIIVRVLLNRFFLDSALVDRQIDLLLDSGGEFVALPYDFNINFGADAMTFGCLKRANEMMAESGASQRFRPWFFIEQHPANFKVVRLDDVPEYPMELAEQIRQSSASRERDCGGCTAFTYEFLRQFLQPSDKLLDLGCGLGDGAASIADAVHEVRGADYDPLTVAEAGARHSTVANLTFDVEDAQALSYPDGTFDVAVSSNSMEHVPNDTLMLANLLRVLRPGGILILEVPLLAERPFGVPLLPSHLREYRPTPLLELVRRAGFKVIHQYGVNRGVYVDWDQAREAALIVAQKTAAESGEGV